MNKYLFYKLSLYFIVIFYLTLDNIYIMENVIRGIGFIKSIVYLSVYSSVVFTILIFLLSESKTIRYITLAVIFLSLSISYTYLDINGYGFRFSEARIMINEMHFAGEAFTTYSSAIYEAIMKSALIVFLFYLISEKFLTYKFSNRWLSFPLLSISSMSFLVIRSLDFYPFPVALKIPSTLVYTYTNSLYFGKRDSVTLEHSKAISNKILFIVDESITSNKTSLNGFNIDSTPFLRSVKDKIYNYGDAVSGANCSSTSNFILQSGVLQENLPDIKQLSLRKANIFKYAKNAGYKTVYIDGQNPESNTYQNFMTKFDYQDIDIYYQIRAEKPNIERYNIDLEGLDFITNLVQEHEKIFIYFNKYGSHFHYEGTYPKSETRFKPVLQSGTWNNDKEKSINSYINSISWSCDHFLKECFGKLNNMGVTTVYTSDHGQNVLDTDSMVTHCKARDSDSYQANVPFIINFDRAENTELKRLLDENYLSNFNHVSHFNIFPTILLLEGYNKDEVYKNYGKSIFDDLGSQKDRYFFSGDLWGRGDCFKNMYMI